jgi:antitoxin PrlF
MATVTVSEKGQIVIPSEMRRKFGITAGTQLEFIEEGATLRVSVKRTREGTRHEDGYGMLVYRGAPRRLAEFDVAKAMRREERR